MRTICIGLLVLCATIFPALAQKNLQDSLFILATEKTASGDVMGATSLFLSAQKIAEANNDTRMLCRIQIGFGKIGLISENDGAVEQAIAKAEYYCNACRDSLSLARLQFQKGVLCIKKYQYEAAIDTLKVCANMYTALKDTLGAAGAYAKIGNILEQEDKHELAQPYYLKFYEAASKKPESTSFLTANIYLTSNYLFLNQNQKALFHNAIAKALAKKLGANFEYSYTLRYDALAYKQMGRYKEAFELLSDRYIPYYQDTLMSEQNLQIAEELKAKYETEQKEDKIALQEAQLGRQQLRFWALMVVLAIVLVAGALLFGFARRLRQRNEEKEFLLREIHHRVKNNLQILSSLLHLQSRQISDETALDAVREGQSRVDAMGLIHEKLYMGDKTAKLEIKEYLEQFGQNILNSFGIDDKRVVIHCNLDRMYLDIDTAIPLGLIINELTTNSLKHAFPDNRTGNITIALWKDPQNKLCLQVSDDGVGATREFKSKTSFGTSLVQTLSKKLKGKVEILHQPHGYATLITFEQYN